MTIVKERQETKQMPLRNEEVAVRLDAVADVLEAQEANPFRVQAYRNAANTLRNLARPAYEILVAEGEAGLRSFVGIGESLAHSIAQLVYAGRLDLLDQLRGETRPERVLATVPGIGPKLAGLIHEQLEIDTLADLSAAAYDGRLAQISGFGPRRLRAVRESLAGRLQPRFQARAQSGVQARATNRALEDQPTVAELLDIDREYREQAKQDKLPCIAPRRYNPTGAAWLPVLHTQRGGTHFTALYSNTARAHELGATHDWVVIYCDENDDNSQWTVVTARYGALQRKRVVRGREKECQEYYARK